MRFLFLDKKHLNQKEFVTSFAAKKEKLKEENDMFMFQQPDQVPALSECDLNYVHHFLQ